jgi:hypothetical protein
MSTAGHMSACESVPKLEKNYLVMLCGKMLCNLRRERMCSGAVHAMTICGVKVKELLRSKTTNFVPPVV